ncbi:MAG: valine--tRNA ligase [Phycisphaerae bacterium]|nr:valine--tRNA ligase [Phycisphaerae bacterium]
MSPSLDKTYNAAAVHEQVARLWSEAGAFHADPAAPGDPYAIVIPPPNVTAALHMGHALNNTLQDVLVRHRRMRGDNAMWMPGTDHAGIATQTVVDKRLQAEGKPALKDYKKLEAESGTGRDQFIEKVQAWKDEYEARITHQLKEMGCSCDWDRQRFTMDPVCAAAVREAFFRLFRDGLIYRGKRLVNWDPVTQTALADDEVEMEEVDGHFWYMKYPVVDAEGRDTGTFATVATTRPETMLGDTAVAVNPQDAERSKFIGQRVRLPIVNRIIPVIGDDYVVLPDAESEDAKARYASGFLKVTPAHDPNDYDIGQRHGLDMINVMAPDASISADHGWPAADLAAADAFLNDLVGLGRYEAREAIVDWFQEQGLLEQVRDYRHTVGHSYRSHVPVEPYLSDQWYVRVTDPRLAGAALNVMAPDQRADSDGCVWKEGDSFTTKTGDLRFYPPRYAKTFQTWHENIRDWCISRQLWWGHRIPVWARPDNAPLPSPLPDHACAIETETGQAVCLREDDAKLIQALEAAGFTRDPDVLDTWFSSALWPISTLGWPDPDAFPDQIPEGAAALDKWNPSHTLCTAREIITLWVSRMVMFNLYFRDCLPFKDVFIHAMIQDGEGQKMSKSLGNGVDPLDIIHSHGADAMRFTLASMTTSTQDVRMPVDLVCPHTGEEFEPKRIRTKAGHVVAAPIQDCPSDPKKKLVTSYGLASGEAEPTEAMPLARNSSTKFDFGRNFCNKLWNAGRFALGHLEGDHTAAPGARSLADRWILSRTARTVTAVGDALDSYEFNAAVQCLYDLFWRDLCDWYLEAIKPVVRQDTPAGATTRQTLAAVLDCVLRLMHPVIPFVTERLWQNLSSLAPDRSLADLALPPSPLCIRAPWPVADAALLRESDEAAFTRLQELVGALRNVRSQSDIPPGRSVSATARAQGPAAEELAEVTGLVQTLCRVEITNVSADAQPAGDAVTVKSGDVEVYLAGLFDAEAEQQRHHKRAEELLKQKKALAGRLNNKGYTEKAPPHLVQETRDQLAEVERELAALQ